MTKKKKKKKNEKKRTRWDSNPRSSDSEPCEFTTRPRTTLYIRMRFAPSNAVNGKVDCTRYTRFTTRFTIINRVFSAFPEKFL